MKKLTKEQLQKDADRLMKAHKVNKIFATQDGGYFLKEHEAVFHNNGLKKEDDECEVIPFSTAPASEAKSDAPAKPVKPAAKPKEDKEKK